MNIINLILWCLFFISLGGLVLILILGFLCDLFFWYSERLEDKDE